MPVFVVNYAGHIFCNYSVSHICVKTVHTEKALQLCSYFLCECSCVLEQLR